MPDAVQIAGKVNVYTQLINTVGNLFKLGETMDMTDVEERAFWHNVPGDRHGGPQGPPIEVQWLGAICVVRMELSRWDAAEIDKLRRREVNATLGTILLAEVGTLMLATKGFRLCLNSATRPLNFPCAILRDAIPYGMGSKFTSVGLQFECHRCQDGTARDGILHNTDVTEYTGGS